MNQKAFRAYGASKHTAKIAATAQAAATAFFAANPSARKCDVIEGTTDGIFFSVLLSRIANESAQQWKDVTRKSVSSLP